MDLIVDFNGYDLPNGKFAIKEYSFRSVFPDVSGNYYSVHNVVTPPLISDSDDLEKFKKLYEVYYERYGIPWDAGLTNYSFMKIILELHLRDATTIYVRNLFIKNLITNLLHEEFNIICLYDYDYAFIPLMSTSCQHHDNPAGNNCANDNTINMINWLHYTKFYLSETRDNFTQLKNKSIQSNKMEFQSADESIEKPRGKKRKLND